MRGLSDHARGVLFAAAGALLWSPDGLLIRLLSADHWQIIAWRSLAFSCVLAGVIVVRHGNALRALWRRSFPAAGWSALSLGGVNVLFILSITHTTVANTLFLLATVPLFAALLGRFFLGDRIPRRTGIAIAVAISGIALILGGDIDGGFGTGNLFGLATAVLFAVNLTLIRRHPEMSLLVALALGGALASSTGFVLSDPFAVSGRDLAIILGQGAVQSTLAIGLFMTAARYLPPAEAGLFTMVETVLGPFWVWLVIREQPAPLALLGGAVVLTALAAHSVLSLRASRRARAGAA